MVAAVGASVLFKHTDLDAILLAQMLSPAYYIPASFLFQVHILRKQLPRPEPLGALSIFVLRKLYGKDWSYETDLSLKQKQTRTKSRRK